MGSRERPHPTRRMTAASRPNRGGDDLALRRAVTSDINAMAAIEASAFSDPWPASAFADLLTAPHARMTVAIGSNGSLLGYCVRLHAADEGEIANIAVAPSARRRGVGAQLLDDAIEASLAEGGCQLFLEVRLSNDAARCLYESRGFLPVGRRSAYYRDPLEDALVMRRQSPALG